MKDQYWTDWDEACESLELNTHLPKKEKSEEAKKEEEIKEEEKKKKEEKKRQKVCSQVNLTIIKLIHCGVIV